jgi:hypothetical protein
LRALSKKNATKNSAFTSLSILAKVTFQVRRFWREEVRHSPLQWSKTPELAEKLNPYRQRKLQWSVLNPGTPHWRFVFLVIARHSLAKPEECCMCKVEEVYWTV